MGGKGLYLGSINGVLALTAPFAAGEWIFGHFDPEVARILSLINIKRDLQTSEKRDELPIHACIQGREGNAGYGRLERRLRVWCAGPRLQECAETNDVDDLRLLCREPGLRVNAESFKRGLGQTPLHSAAAFGSAEALQLLLELGMDPNIEDTRRERPLHYGVLCGHIAMVRLLLAGRADPYCEAQDGSTALDVAKENPAAFLGVDTVSKESGFITLLEQAMLIDDCSSPVGVSH